MSAADVAKLDSMLENLLIKEISVLSEDGGHVTAIRIDFFGSNALALDIKAVPAFGENADLEFTLLYDGRPMEQRAAPLTTKYGDAEYIFMLNRQHHRVRNLSVRQCRECFALVVEDFMPEHMSAVHPDAPRV